jgi:hypothetical protein
VWGCITLPKIIPHDKCSGPCMLTDVTTCHSTWFTCTVASWSINFMFMTPSAQIQVSQYSSVWAHTSHFGHLTEDWSFRGVPPHWQLNGEPMSCKVISHSSQLFPCPFRRLKSGTGSQNNTFPEVASHFLVPAMHKICSIQLLHGWHPGWLRSSAWTSHSILLVHHNHFLYLCSVHTSSICCEIDVSSWLMIHFWAPCTPSWQGALSCNHHSTYKKGITSQSVLHDKLLSAITTAHQHIP